MLYSAILKRPCFLYTFVTLTKTSCLHELRNERRLKTNIITHIWPLVYLLLIVRYYYHFHIKIINNQTTNIL